jgi:hypothetical protein
MVVLAEDLLVPHMILLDLVAQPEAVVAILLDMNVQDILKVVDDIPQSNY